jgi:hypothetical protein
MLRGLMIGLAATLVAGVPAAEAEGLYGSSHPRFEWTSPDGGARYRIGGSGVELLDCMSSAMALHEASRAYTPKKSDADWRAEHTRLIAEWRTVMTDFLENVPDRVPPAEFQCAAQMRIGNWRDTAADMAQWSAMPPSEQARAPARLQNAAFHYQRCESAAKNW